MQSLLDVEKNREIISAGILRDITQNSYKHINWQEIIPYLNKAFLSAANKGMTYCDIPVGVIPEAHEDIVFNKLNSLGYLINKDFKTMGKIRIYWEEEYND